MHYSLLAFSKRSRCRRRHRGHDGLHCVHEQGPGGPEMLDSGLVLYYLKEGRGDTSEGLEGEGMDPEGHSGGVAQAPSSRQGPGRHGLDDPGQDEC